VLRPIVAAVCLQVAIRNTQQGVLYFSTAFKPEVLAAPAAAAPMDDFFVSVCPEAFPWMKEILLASKIGHHAIMLYRIPVVKNTHGSPGRDIESVRCRASERAGGLQVCSTSVKAAVVSG